MMALLGSKIAFSNLLNNNVLSILTFQSLVPIKLEAHTIPHFKAPIYATMKY